MMCINVIMRDQFMTALHGVHKSLERQMDQETTSVLSKRPLATNAGCQVSERSAKTPRIPDAEDGPSNLEKLESLIATFYPQYARLRFIPIMVETDGMLASGSKNTAAENEPHWRCKVYIFEMYLECRETFISVEEAREAVAKLALDLLNEFNRVIRSRSTDARFGRLFQPLIETMTQDLANCSMDAEEQRAVDMGHDPVLSVEQYKTYGSLDMQKSVLSAGLQAIYEKMNSAGISTAKPEPALQPAKAVSKASAAAQLSPEDQLGDPLSAIHMHFQKRGGSVEAPDFQIFEGKTKLLFGCIGKYDGKSYIAEGIYKTKKEAKRAAAILICQDLFGMTGTLASGEAVVASKPAIVASSLDVKGTAKTIEGRDGDGSVAEAQEPIEPASELFGEEPPKGKKFVSLVNECCQVHRLNQPDYQCKTGDSISSYFIIHAFNHFDKATVELMGGHVAQGKMLPRRFVSAACTKKMDAKEDCAGRIYAFLRKHGVFDADGNLVRRETNRSQRGHPGGRGGYRGNQGRYYDNQPPSNPQAMQSSRFNFPAVPSWPPALSPLGLPPMAPLPPFPFPQAPGLFPLMPPPPLMMPPNGMPPFPMIPTSPSVPASPQNAGRNAPSSSAPSSKAEDPRKKPK